MITLILNTFDDDDDGDLSAFMPEDLVDLADQLNEITNTSTPLLPNDIILTANALNNIIL